MLNKFWYLTKISLKKKMASKWFITVNILLFIGIIGIANIDTIINYFGGDFTNTQKIIVVDKSNKSFDLLSKQIKDNKKVLGIKTKTKLTLKNDYDEAIKKIKKNNDIVILIEDDSNNYIKANVVSNGFIDNIIYNLISTSLINTKSMLAFQNSTISAEEINKLTASISLNRIILDENKTSSEENINNILGVIFPTITLPFFILVIYLIQMIGMEINEEKSTKSMEIIISNVTPKAHFFSKILSSNIFVISQGILLFLYGLIAFFLKGIFSQKETGGIFDFIKPIFNSLKEIGFIDKLIYIIPLALILIVLSFLAYSLVAGVLASMTTNIEDYQQVQTPIMIVLLLGYYLSIMAGMFQGSIFIRILSYIPFISALLSPSLLVLGQIGIIDVIISIGILSLFNIVFLRYGLKVYKKGILNYSTTKIWNKIFKAAKS